ncbi:NrtR DNA-binding winged helix domain-containing protein [Acetobacter conturbans]|uniref:NrtR DNA-binding winged helix domain-containing protein n=1 Tax=Acetobacter conturbans TaxID=1737472 RepID=UPI0030CE9D60
MIAAIPISLRAGEPFVLTDGQGGLPHALLAGGEEKIRETLESLLVTRRRVPVACADQLPVRVYEGAGGSRVVELPYLVTARTGDSDGEWTPCYEFLPWEDQRSSHGITLRTMLGERLLAGLTPALTTDMVQVRRKLSVLFALEGRPWRPDLVAERCRALIEAEFLPEEGSSGAAHLADTRCYKWLAQALGYLRKPLPSLNMPVELMPERFTIPQFQASVEGVLGEALDKQAFRRNVSHCGLLEETGGVSDEIFGRPARLFRFRLDIAVARNAQSLSLALPLADAVSRSETIETLLFPSRAKKGSSLPPDET